MVRIEDATVVRKDGHGHRYEVLVDPDLVQDFRAGKDVNPRNLFAIVEVFKDARKGDRASDETLDEAFGTTNREKVALEIAKSGEFNLTTKQRKEMVEEIRNRIIDLIMRNSIDPRTNAPHPRTRLENAFEKAGIHVNTRPASDQIDDIVDALRPILPISFGKSKLKIIIPAQYSQSTYGTVHKLGKVLGEEWLANGSLEVVLEVPSGTRVDVIETLGNATKGEVIVTEV